MKEITAAELKERLERGEKLNIIDVREDEEVAFGMIPGAKHIKMGDIPNRLNEFNKEETYIFICRAGVRSEHVCRYLEEQGYDVCNVIDGMLAWDGELV
ncbi:rhodanese-like domain-containing protein [Thermolongibacillus altinsuensis]|jgi:rhodanese-related sulfurtransferase|uniref:rhodanese-like domain-containing protein n=1 Tax=Thermolongibacillus altinsuensis TaxID=575256 RepID=UPI00242A2BD5|nr:rhodanese-like domain-containing protein [Thermolongibacillus altinsuensis]GMB09853.1 rhodanese-like domain-containing protein [Thermolongibacillus altinsuensis]